MTHNTLRTLTLLLQEWLCLILDEKGNQEVWDAVYQGVQNLKFLSMLFDVHGQVPIVAGLGVRGPRFCNSNACVWH